MTNRFAGFTAAWLLAAFSQLAYAQAFPAKPIRLIVPFPPGGPVDIIARALAPAMGSRLGQPIIVENRAGAGGVVGVNVVAKSPADGYALVLSGPGALVAAPFMMDNFPYDVMRDLTPVTLVARIPGVMVANPSAGFKTVRQLIDYAKANPGKLSYASAGSGTLTHLTGELLKIEAKMDIVHIPYKGGAPATTDLLGGTVQLMFPDLPAVLPQIRNGSLLALAVTTSSRAASLPQVPTVAEAGFPAVISESLYGLLGPAGMPAPVLQLLHSSAVDAMRRPEVSQQMDNVGATASPTSSEEYRNLIQADRNRWERVIKITGTKMD